MIFSLKRERARVVLKRWEGDKDVLTLNQVHSSKLHVVDAFINGLEGDAIITQKPNLKIGIRTADCVPVALLGKNTIGVIHAGWRGLKEGVIEKTLQKLSFFEPLANFLAFVGPSAKACCYEVGTEFKELFTSLYYRKGKYHMDTQEEALLRLRGMGIKNFYLYKTCTICHHALPSHRKDKTQDRLLTYAEILL